VSQSTVVDEWTLASGTPEDFDPAVVDIFRQFSTSRRIPNNISIINARSTVAPRISGYWNVCPEA
jgi:hypothetical protein